VPEHERRKRASYWADDAERTNASEQLGQRELRALLEIAPKFLFLFLQLDERTARLGRDRHAMTRRQIVNERAADAPGNGIGQPRQRNDARRRAQHRVRSEPAAAELRPT